MKEKHFSKKNAIFWNAILKLYKNKEPITNISVFNEVKGKLESHEVSELFRQNEEIPSGTLVDPAATATISNTIA